MPSNFKVSSDIDTLLRKQTRQEAADYLGLELPITDWGDITGTLSDQTDLQDALDAKAPILNATFEGTTTIPSADITTADITTADFNAGVVGGELSWNNAEKTLDLVTGSDNVTIQLGQEVLLYARNNSGSAMSDGQVVIISGSQGNRPTISLAQANTVASARKTIGVVTQSIPNNSNGFVTLIGKVRDLVLDSGTFTEGEVVYLSDTVAGGITNVKPSIVVELGHILATSTGGNTNGVLEVQINNESSVYDLEQQLSTLINDNTAAIAAKIPNASTTGTPSATTFLRGDNAWASAGGATPTIAVADAAAMQVIIDSGSVEIGQLFSLVSDRSIRRFEGDGKSRVISDQPQRNPAGYARFETVRGANISNIKVNATGATGWCYSVDGGSPVYFAGSDTTNRTISIPAGGGVPRQVDIWPANSTSSGRVGDLTYLVLNNGDLTSVDISGLTALSFLFIGNNQLTSVDVSGLTALTTLYCQNNQLTSLDVSGLTALTYLSCTNNQLASLDVSGLTALTQLYCFDNQLTSVDVSGLTALTNLSCSTNQITSLDVSGLTALTNLTCNNNQITSLDVSDSTALTYLYCQSCQLESLDVSGLTGLIKLDASNNQLTSVTGVGFDGSYYYHSWFGTDYANFKNNLLTTDAVYTLLSQMANAVPASGLELDGNPCEVGNVLQDGVTYTAAETSALAATKSLTLVLN